MAVSAQAWAKEKPEESPRHREWVTVKHNGAGSKSFDQSSAMEAVSQLPPGQITVDLNAITEYAGKLPASDSKLLVAGFSRGGGQSFRFATDHPDLAAIVFHGTPPDKDAMTRIKAPVYGFYACNDARIDATIAGAPAEMKQAGKTYESVTYDEAGPGFMRAGEAPDATPANAKARSDAFARLESR